MPTVKGKLVLQGKRFMVQLPTKKGTANFAIPEIARQFSDNDASHDLEVDVELDGASRLIRVTIPGKAIIAPKITSPSVSGNYRKAKESRFSHRPGSGRPLAGPSIGGNKPAVRTLPKASPNVIGEPFHNPYTFIPFEVSPIRPRCAPTLRTADEQPGELDRLTGVIRLAVKTLSPLMSCSPVPESEDETTNHKVYRALTIGNDVIVPSTSIRGSLRTLMTILTGGTLGYLDPTAYLIQGRDATLGPRGINSRNDVPQHVFLAEVVVPGNANRDGTIRLGRTELVKLMDLEGVVPRDVLQRRAPNSDAGWIGLDENQPMKHSANKSNETPWRLKLSGRVVGGRSREERKREGAFLPGETAITVPAALWEAYMGRNAFGDRPELRERDLIWLQPHDPNTVKDGITDASQIKSLQWSRWGKLGRPLRDHVPPPIRPDSGAKDGLVDEVTNLFGQVNDETTRRIDNDKQAISFAGRIHPENLVFWNAAPQCKSITLAPLSPPHPGCLAFYRDNKNADGVSFDDPLRGYKVYRNTQETGDTAPWHYQTQGVYDQYQLKAPQQRVNKTVALVPTSVVGTLNIAFRAMTKRELALLIQCCSVSWRLGGGKPLGLGRCSVSILDIRNEDGDALKLQEIFPDGWSANVADIAHRVHWWEASQQPVAKMRYPRAVRGNSRGGHAWFQTHAKPRMVSAGDDQQRQPGVSPLYIGGELLEKARVQGHQLDVREPMISGQLLPLFDAEHPQDDVLYGYDMIGHAEVTNKNVFTAFEKFDSKVL